MEEEEFESERAPLLLFATKPHQDNLQIQQPRQHFVLRCPTRDEFYSEQTSHFRDCHDVLGHILSFLSDKRHVPLRRVSCNFLAVVDSGGAPGRLTSTLREGILRHNKKVDDRFQQELGTRSVYGLGSAMVCMAPMVFMLVLIVLLPKLQWVFFGTFVLLGFVALLTVIPLLVMFKYILRNVPRQQLNFSLVLELLVFTTILCYLGSTALLAGSQWRYATIFNHQVSAAGGPWVAECPDTFAELKQVHGYPGAIRFMHPELWVNSKMSASGRSDAEAAANGTSSSSAATTRQPRNLTLLGHDDTHVREKGHGKKKGGGDEGSGSNGGTGTPMWVQKYIGPPLPCQSRNGTENACVLMPSTFQSVTSQASCSLEKQQNCTFLAVNPELGWYKTLPPNSPHFSLQDDWFTNQWWSSWSKPYASGEEFPIDETKPLARFRMYAFLYLLSSVILMAWNLGSYAYLVAKRESRKVSNAALAPTPQRTESSVPEKSESSANTTHQEGDDKKLLGANEETSNDSSFWASLFRCKRMPLDVGIADRIRLTRENERLREQLALAVGGASKKK